MLSCDFFLLDWRGCVILLIGRFFRVRFFLGVKKCWYRFCGFFRVFGVVTLVLKVGAKVVGLIFDCVLVGYLISFLTISVRWIWFILGIWCGFGMVIYLFWRIFSVSCDGRGWCFFYWWESYVLESLDVLFEVSWLFFGIRVLVCWDFFFRALEVGGR